MYVCSGVYRLWNSGMIPVTNVLPTFQLFCRETGSAGRAGHHYLFETVFFPAPVLQHSVMPHQFFLSVQLHITSSSSLISTIWRSVWWVVTCSGSSSIISLYTELQHSCTVNMEFAWHMHKGNQLLLSLIFAHVPCKFSIHSAGIAIHCMMKGFVVTVQCLKWQCDTLIGTRFASCSKSVGLHTMACSMEVCNYTELSDCLSLDNWSEKHNMYPRNPLWTGYQSQCLWNGHSHHSP